ncbi:MAG TPA: class I SAM-dependent methyltransferase [Mycobacteriales bacterium]
MNAVLRQIDAVNAAHPWSHNDHYLRWVLRQVPPGARRALDVGCGTGTLLRALAAVVPQTEGIDRDARVAGLAGARVAGLFDLAPVPAYDVVTAVAVLHHLPLRPALERLRALVRSGGRLVVVGCYRASTPADHAVGLAAIPANLLVGLVRSTGTAPAGMSAAVAPATETLPQIRAAARTLLPGARIRRRLFWRYTLTWTAGGPGSAGG